MKKNWQTVELQDIAEVGRGKFSVRPRNDPKYFGGDIPFLQTGDVAGASGSIISTYSQTLNEEGLKVSKFFPAGTLLITIAANIGDVAEVGFGFACTDSLVAVQPKEGVDKNWLKFFLQTQKSYFESRATQNAQANINLQTIRPLLIELPPKNEQTAIASLLSTWDLFIEKTERLIAAKEKQKKSFMQSLLTGKQRVKGFQKSWSEFNLSELFKERSERGNEVLPLISITRENGIIPRNEDRKDTSNEDKSKYLRICPGDIGYNTMRMWQGVSALSSLEGIVSPAYTICTPKKSVDGEFMAYLFKLPRIINLFYRHSQGLTSDTWNLKYHHFQEIKVTIPKIEEQKAIARTLKVCDEELDLLKKQADAYRRQKRGLMQRLLTGEWRVKVNGVTQ
ncbi:MAG: restriction endonuclease subunit S [Desulfuromonadaceae bacterium]|nr:restriction endonuclease subunit S [Desulfuromonadaceae bacterium]MDD2847198.1 restriction endonuclease subunit S [Desulfuromonadaceae bacterium]MDD4130142.1 restriction endonuclease subunit S [Desulfuromonadaceae bacterium]